MFYDMMHDLAASETHPLGSPLCSVALLSFSLLSCIAAPQVDTSENHSGSAMLMLLSVVVVGLAVFVVYKFKR